MKLLLVEDDELLGYGICSGLAQCNYTVRLIKDGLTAWHVIQTEEFDLIILDLGLPKLSGDEILKNMREKKILTPVIILTAHGDIQRRIRVLDGGADEYMTKPFNLEELCARIRAVHRRAKSRSNAQITAGDITLDPVTKLVFKDSKMLELTRREFKLLQMLLENAGKVITREKAIQDLYGWNFDVDSNALEVHIHSLRKKLNCKSIIAIRGVGYKLAEVIKKKE
jgi:two-component system, OmpR family, response regulator QseB